MQSGRIRQISKYRGFGFIKGDSGGDVFFQRADVKGVTFDLSKEGQRVKFSIGLSPRGFQAQNVELVKTGGKNVLEKESSDRGAVEARGGEAARTKVYRRASGKTLSSRPEAES